jgi:hypothetical protein
VPSTVATVPTAVSMNPAIPISARVSDFTHLSDAIRHDQSALVRWESEGRLMEDPHDRCILHCSAAPPGTPPLMRVSD